MKLFTLTQVTQSGAKLFAILSGPAEDVQRDLYLASNHGLCKVPEHYMEGDMEVHVESNVYRVTKYAASVYETACLARGGWRALRRARADGDVTRYAKTRARVLIRRARTSGCMDSAADMRNVTEWHNTSLSRMGAPREVMPISQGMASVAAYADRVATASEYAASK